MKTASLKQSEITNNWLIIDATGVSLGRLAAFIATRLKGKHKASYTPHMDCGDNIIVINAQKVGISGKNKLDRNTFYWHTGYPGGIKEKSWRDILFGKYPERLLMSSVKRMLPGGPLSRAQLRRLYIYCDSEHPHAAQKPSTVDIQKFQNIRMIGGSE